MAEVEFAYMIFLGGFIVIMAAYLLNIRSKAKIQSLRFALFDVRDELIYLAAQGKVSEQDRLFQILYGGTNLFIKNVKEFNSFEFIRAIDTICKNDKLVEGIKEFQTLYEHACPEMKELLERFTKVVVQIAFRSVIPLNIIRSTVLFDLLKKSIRKLSKRFPQLRDRLKHKFQFVEMSNRIYHTSLVFR